MDKDKDDRQCLYCYSKVLFSSMRAMRSIREYGRRRKEEKAVGGGSFGRGILRPADTLQ